MSRTSSGKTVALLTGMVVALILAVVAWRTWPHFRLWLHFEPLGRNEHGCAEFRHRETGIVFVQLPGGTFRMGAQKAEPGGRNYSSTAYDYEAPVHEVTLSPFLIGKYEVTQGQWARVMGDNWSWFRGDNVPLDVVAENLPVEEISWFDIQEFRARTGLELPTEAQWEYACRADTESAFSFGAGGECEDQGCTPCRERDGFMWYCANSDSRTHEVGGKLPNPFGLHDMHGNVAEWCVDRYESDFYSKSIQSTDPVCLDPQLRQHVYRGGSWGSHASMCTSSCRAFAFPNGFEFVGFRPVAPCP